MTGIWKHGRLQGWQVGDRILPVRVNFRTRDGDVACNNLHCGDVVVDVEDERHDGEVLSIHNGSARVRWIGTSWISDVAVEKLRKIAR